MALVIKKIVDLSSLGDEYKGIEIIFRSIPAKDLGEINKKQEALPKDENGDQKLEDILPLFIEILQKYFVSGKQDEEKLTKEDITELDSESLIYCFQILTGQDIDPKAKSESTSSSTTEPETAQKSESTNTESSSS